MSKSRPTPQQQPSEPSPEAGTDLKVAAVGVSIFKEGDRYKVFKDGSPIGQLWRNPLGAWGYTTSDGHDGFIHLRRGTARDALLKRHLKRSHHETGELPPSAES